MRRRKDEDLGVAVAFILLLFGAIYFAWKNHPYLFYLGIILLVLFGMGFLYYLSRKKQKRFDSIYKWHTGKELLQRLRRMHPTEFEYYIADLYRRLGYQTEQVGGPHDGNVDVIAKKDGITHYIQCKKFITRQVTVHDVREFAGTLVGKLADGNGIFITTNFFTTDAKQYARENRIEDVDGDALLRLVELAGKQSGNTPVTSPAVLPGVSVVPGVEPNIIDRTYAILKEAARHKRLITYGTLYQSIGLVSSNPLDRKRGSDILTDVNQLSIQDKNVMISSIVVKQDTRVPGGQYFALVEKLGRIRAGATEPEKMRFWTEECKHIYASYN